MATASLPLFLLPCTVPQKQDCNIGIIETQQANDMEIIESNYQDNFSIAKADSNNSCGVKPQVQALAISPQDISIQEYMNSGYATDDESSDCEDITGEPVDSGRTRSSKRKAANQTNQQAAKDEKVTIQEDKPEDNKGRKRKKNAPGQGSGSDSDEDGHDRSRIKVDDINGLTGDPPVCSCPKDIMTCIGILPSLPIVSQFVDSDDSEFSQEEDSWPTLLPTVARGVKHRTAHE